MSEEANKTRTRNILIIVGVVLVVGFLCLVAVIAVLTMTGVFVGQGISQNISLGGGKLDFPQYPSTTDIEIEDDELAMMLTDYVVWPKNFLTETQFYWTEDEGDDVKESLEAALKDADWDEEIAWGQDSDSYTVWKKDDLHVEYLVFPEIEDYLVDMFDNDYNVTLEEDVTVVLAVAWDESQPASITGLGWGTCDFPESDLTIACVESISSVGEVYEEGDGFWEMQVVSGFFPSYLFEADEDGLEYLDDDSDIEIDLEDPLIDIFAEVAGAESNPFDYDEEDIETIRTGAGRMLIALFEDDYGDPGVLGVGVYEENLILYIAWLSDDYDEEVQLEFHKNILDTIREK